MGSGYHDPPYPGPRDGDYVPYREFEALVRRFERLETRQLGEAITRLEERQQAQNVQLGKIEVTLASVEARAEALQKAETQRLGFRLGTKGVIAVTGAIVAIFGGIVGTVIAILSSGG